MRKIFRALFSSLSFMFLPPAITAAPIHLAVPPIYDNAEPPLQYGQTFVAEDSSMTGIRVYIGDPSRPGNPQVNELVGPADLVLYDASNLSGPVEIARGKAVPSGQNRPGLSSLLVNRSVPTTPGNRYFFCSQHIR